MKTPEKCKDLEKWRVTFFQIGVILALSLSLAAFEWKSAARPFTLHALDPFDGVSADLVAITVQKPDLPTPPKPQTVTVFTMVDDKKVVIDDFMIDVGDDQSKPIEPFVPILAPEPEPTHDFEIFVVAETMPDFPGGYPALHVYLRRNIQYPEMARQLGISGTVYISFIVDIDGKIGQVAVLRGIGGGCDEEALRVVNSMPKWSPGKQRGKPVRVAMSIPVKFVLL